ncbi:hypothetical protein [Halalkalibacterium ligniniphilum]|uniref:hypothetical protein n=1 Tax=Halalkalibacterium ligniniphilum TaxID=1134413 RepID=UPI00034A950F|nr:hypothetical protein [Halalkalibacterium ligniniphilum]
MSYDFIFDERLGISLPNLHNEWELYEPHIQEKILFEWEQIRGQIPDRVQDVEKQINEHQRRLYEEEDFERSCMLNSKISELASVINDLWIWFRINQATSAEPTHS